MINLLLESTNVSDGMIAFIIFLIVPPIIFLSIFIPVAVNNRRHSNFVLEHSVAVKQFKNINSLYHFKIVKSFNLSHSYDNENMYDDISPQDYLTYQLVYIRKDVEKAMEATLENRSIYPKYKQALMACHRNVYDVDTTGYNVKKLNKYEYRILANLVAVPVVTLSINILLLSTYLNGNVRESKSKSFDEKEIKLIIAKLNNKRGSFYLDEGVWNSICRVERGKVTNKMRFAIYARDNYRCRRCGRKRDDLEIDHIIPIAKGGKSTMDNLQCLCKRCNREKGTDIIRY